MSSDDEVGPGRPPKKHRFKKGQSGNPRGRPKGSRNIRSLLEEKLNARVTIQEHGRERRITVRELMMAQLVTSAAKGSLKHTQMVLTLLNEAGQEQSSEASADLPKLDKASLRRIERSLHRLTTASEEPA